MYKAFRRWRDASHISKDLALLFSHRVIHYSALALLGIFYPIYLFQHLGESFDKLLFFYLINWLLFLFLLPVGAKMMTYLGLTRSMIVATPLYVLFFLLLYWFDLHPTLIFLSAFLLAMNIARIFYWVPFHTEMAEFTDKKNRGKQYSSLVVVIYIVSIFLPVLASIIIEKEGFRTLFIVSIFLMSLATIPLLMIRNVREVYSFSYIESFIQLFKKENVRSTLLFMAEGADGFVGTAIWPIYIWIILDHKYTAVGILSSLIIAFTVLVQLGVGRMADKIDKKRLLKIGSVLDAFGWVVKVFVSTASHVFFASTYHNFARILRGTSLQTFFYERAADKGHYVDEYTVLKEMSLNLGRLAMVGAIALCSYFFGISVAFILAAISVILLSAVVSKV